MKEAYFGDRAHALQITAFVHDEWTLGATWATKAAPALPAAAVCESTLLFVTERGLKQSHQRTIVERGVISQT